MTRWRRRGVGRAGLGSGAAWRLPEKKGSWRSKARERRGVALAGEEGELEEQGPVSSAVVSFFVSLICVGPTK